MAGLMSSGGGKLRRVCVWSSSKTHWNPYENIDVSSLLPERIWKKLTIDNFGAVIKSVWCDAKDPEVGRGNSGTSTYNAETGMLKWFTGTYRNSNGGSVPRRVFEDVFCWYVE